MHAGSNLQSKHMSARLIRQTSWPERTTQFCGPAYGDTCLDCTQQQMAAGQQGWGCTDILDPAAACTQVQTCTMQSRRARGRHCVLRPVCEPLGQAAGEPSLLGPAARLHPYPLQQGTCGKKWRRPSAETEARSPSRNADIAADAPLDEAAMASRQQRRDSCVCIIWRQLHLVEAQSSI